MGNPLKEDHSLLKISDTTIVCTLETTMNTLIAKSKAVIDFTLDDRTTLVEGWKQNFCNDK